MAEERGGVIQDWIARFRVLLEGAEEAQRGLSETEESALQFARSLQESKLIMDSLSKSLQKFGIDITGAQLQKLPQTTRFLEEWAKAMGYSDEKMMQLSPTMWALTEEGKKVAQSLYQIVPPATTLKDKFGDLGAAARALLRIWVSFQIVMQTLRVFQDMAEASAILQAELFRLRAVVTGLSDDIEGGVGTWDEWLERIQRLRAALPGISMVEIIDSLKGLTAVLGPLGLTVDEIEKVSQLVGQMSIIFGEDFPAYAQTFVSALGGAQRSVGNFGVDLRDSNQAMRDYAESLGFAWDELNAGQREWIRLGYFVQESTKLTGLLTEAEDEEWLQLEELRQKRQDILAQSPELIAAQIKWAELLLTTAQLLEKIVGLIDKYSGAIGRFGQATLTVLSYLVPNIQQAKQAWAEFQKSLEWEAALEWIDRIKEPWQEAAEGARDFDETVKENVQSLGEQEGAAEDLRDALVRAYQQAQNAVRSYQNAVEQAGINLSRRLADIARNLEQRLVDLEARFEAQRDQLIARFEERRADIRQDAAEREEDLREDLNKRLRRMEEDHLNEMRELREDYLLDLEEAARSRDAISMRQIQQRYILEKSQREREYGINRRRTIEDFQEQLDDLKKAREEQERELEESLERQLRELQENYIRQQEEARLNAERQREDALRNYREQLDDLWRNLQERLETIILNLMEEEEEYKGVYGQIRTFFDEWYKDDLEKMWLWLEERRKLLEEAGLMEPRPPIPYPRPPWRPGPKMGYGGVGLATSPTEVLVGERGPEFFAAWPAGQRMPSQTMDIRLTIDGTQTGRWSADFETQMLRILRGVLEEVV